MNLKCYVIDDEQHAIDVLSRYINNTPGLDLIGTEIKPLDAFSKIGNGELIPDIIFVDIDMPDLSGMDFAEIMGNRSMIIFATAYPEYAAGAFDKNALDYILKPITYERFLKAVDKARQKIADRRGRAGGYEKAHFYVKVDVKGKLLKIVVDDIVYIESKQNYIQIMQEKTSHLTYLSLTEIEAQLPADQFMRCHKSFIANLDKVKIVEAGMISFADGKQILLGVSYKEKFMMGIERTLIKSKRN